ncbi:methionine synthase reductase-like [Coccinella septempunctata]|uniref:methionine synthase reductase-like n=1 Tax=Coccinella septempunctata TaxID=41139 RepID=UPI001D068633|nr:methionine synthase reductase-like [Coccinella septempunctata]
MEQKSKLKISYDKDLNEIPPNEYAATKYRITPFSSSDIISSSICKYELITNEEDRKVYHLRFSTDNTCFNYQPGYTIGILPSNCENLVEKILVRLGLEHVADKCYHVCVEQINAKKTLPKHIPICGTLRNVLLHNVDLNSVPKKLFLRSLINYTEDENERDKISYLCSPKGSTEYLSLISNHSKRSVLALLETFSSCKPPIEILLEYLPPLLPRPYSICSSPLNNDYLSITFNVDKFSDGSKGLCVSWLEKCIRKFENDKQCLVPMYLRSPSKFVLPQDDSVPIIMVATGTGISPFRGFLEHRHLQPEKSFGKSWLFYGCRDSGSNYLFKEDLKKFVASGALTRLSECFSRESGTKEYVQDVIEKYTDELGYWILQDEAVVYLCGEFSKVLPAVKKAILQVFMSYRHLQEDDAKLLMKKMEDEGRYIVDSWN